MGVAHSTPRTACVSPLTDDDSFCSVRLDKRSKSAFVVDEATVRSACAALPRWNVAPSLSSFCCYFRGEALDAVGPLNPAFTEGPAALSEWVSRAQNLGFIAKRANRVFVGSLTKLGARESPVIRGDAGSTADLGSDQSVESQAVRFAATTDQAVVAHAVELLATGSFHVAYDLRYLPKEQVGTRTYAVSLLRAMERLADVRLTLLVRDSSQAEGFHHRVVTENEWNNDVAVVHRPAQIFDVRDLRLLYESSAHLVITYQDLIAYRIPKVFPSDEEYQKYRATSCLSLQGMQRIIAYSESAADEIVQEFGIPRDEVTVIPLGVDAGHFARHDQCGSMQLQLMGLPPQFFFSVATDFPHKNLPGLLEAYRIFRRRWHEGQPPELILAGYATSARSGLYQSISSGSSDSGVRFLGPVSTSQLCLLYQNAEAMIFPSLYEGFGLPPLEAMAAGTPVIAMPFSSVPEVGGDCVLYPDGLSPKALAQAMFWLSSDERLRDDLRRRGLERVKEFQWEKTAKATLEVYRLAVLRPSARSLDARRRLRDAILRWADPPHGHAEAAEGQACQPVNDMSQMGIRTALRALNVAVQRRVKNEVRRITPRPGRRRAGNWFPTRPGSAS